MLFADITGLGTLFSNQLVVWGVFAAGLLIWGCITAATVYHWKKYRVNQSHGYGLFSVYWLGSAALILLAVGAFITHLYL